MTASEWHNIYIYIFAEYTIYCVPPAVLSRRIQPLRINLCAVAALPFLMRLDDAAGMENCGSRVQMAVRKKNIRHLRWKGEIL